MGLEDVYIEQISFLVYSFALTKETQLGGDYPYRTTFQ